jgi:hypothetical protein
MRIRDFYRIENVCFCIDTAQHLDAALPDKIKPLRQAVLNDLWYVLASLAEIDQEWWRRYRVRIASSARNIIIFYGLREVSKKICIC